MKKVKLNLYEHELRKNKNSIIEIFGLPKSGKTSLMKELKSRGFNVALSKYQRNPNNPEDRNVVKTESTLKKTLFFLRHFLMHPWKSIYLFYKLNSNWIIIPGLNGIDYIKIGIMRNKYLAAVLGRYYLVEKMNEKIFIDEFIFQSLFMILQKKSDEKEIKRVLRCLPEAYKILVIEIDKKERERRMRKSISEGQTIILKNEYIKDRDKNQTFNYDIIKRIMDKEYGPTKKMSKKDLFKLKYSGE